MKLSALNMNFGISVRLLIIIICFLFQNYFNVVQIASFIFGSDTLKSVLLPESFTNDELNNLIDSKIEFIKISQHDLSVLVKKTTGYNVDLEYDCVGAFKHCQSIGLFDINDLYLDKILYLIHSEAEKFGTIQATYKLALSFNERQIRNGSYPFSAYIPVQNDDFLIWKRPGSMKRYD